MLFCPPPSLSLKLECPPPPTEASHPISRLVKMFLCRCRAGTPNGVERCVFYPDAPGQEFVEILSM